MTESSVVRASKFRSIIAKKSNLVLVGHRIRQLTLGSVAADFVASTAPFFTFHARSVAFEAVVSPFEVLTAALKIRNIVARKCPFENSPLCRTSRLRPCGWVVSQSSGRVPWVCYTALSLGTDPAASGRPANITRSSVFNDYCLPVPLLLKRPLLPGTAGLQVKRE